MLALLILGLALTCILLGGLVGYAIGDWLALRPFRRQLPPATPRALARVRRSSNRADIREALARHGIELREQPAPVVRPYVPLPVDDFDADDKETW